jgi:UDP-N-acetylmuramoyl-L-alanyl-D-glutamate--2,6-diaminopimelate ligase
MRLDQLIGAAAGAGAPAALEITQLAYDSRRVTPGTLFFCVPGFERDGHEFAPEAIARGAAALVVERPLGLEVPEIVVDSVRAAMAPAAAAFFGDPTATLRVVGVTGTNGKTTTAFLVRALLEAGGLQSALMGTVKTVIGGVEREAVRTTPEAIDLQAAFADMLAAGDRACAIEVSSHALELRRADAIHFAAAIFTNLSRDHLDFHPTMDAYFDAKRRLFEADPGVIVTNVGDDHGRRLASDFPAAVTIAVDGPADYSARDVRTGLHGAEFTLVTRDRELPLRSPLPGRFNVANVLGAIAAVHALGLDLDTIAAALPDVAPVPGRFQPVDEGQPFALLVDYAHTPDSLDNVLRAARPLTDGRVICVFGCGGDRDRGKRPQMGRIAAALADIVVVTSDNPRSEEPAAIIDEILAGALGERGADDGWSGDRAATVESIVDRREAIARAVALAAPGDVVVIAGKGHEQGQEFEAGRKLPFDDAQVSREELRAAGLAHA